MNSEKFREKYEPLLLEVITPRYVWKMCNVGANLVFARNENAANGHIQDIGQTQGLPLQGEDIKKHLQGCDEIILLAVTIGLQVDELIHRTEAADMSGAVVLDALASIAVERLCDEAIKKIQLSTVNCQLSTRYSPGYGDFPLEVQSEILAILDAKKKIGLYVNESNLLIPRKSITAVIGVKK